MSQEQPVTTPFGYVPTDTHPDRNVTTYWNALVVCWDLKDSTQKVTRATDSFEAYWQAQTSVLSYLTGFLPPHIRPDLCLPTGDGFLWIFNLERIHNRLGPGGQKAMLIAAAEPIIGATLKYQARRSEARPRTDPHGVEHIPETNSAIDGSPMVEGRFGAAMGNVDVHERPAERGGMWVAPVGEPLFLASRLTSMAPDYGALVEAEAFPTREPSSDLVPATLAATRERISPKGWPREVVAWRFVPKA